MSKREAEVRDQRTAGRRQTTEGKKQRSEVGSQRSEDRRGLLENPIEELIYTLNVNDASPGDLNYTITKILLGTIPERYKDFNDKNVSIVFDGSKRFDDIPFDHIETGIKVIFSKNGKSADTVIERMIYKLSDKSTALVVTSDHLVRMMIGGMGARSVSAEEFELMIKN